MTETTETLDRVMVIAAHPDDPEFGCGGTIAKWAQAGKKITYLLFTSGDKGSHNPTIRAGQLATQREEEQRAAARELGVQEVIYLRHPDGILENTMELRRQVAKIVRAYKPHIVLAIDPWRHYQLHPDHRAAGYAALDGIWAAREWHIFAEQLMGDEEPWRVKEAYLFWTENADYWEDITATVDQCITALTRHVSQVGTDHTKLAERIRERTQKTGEPHGYAHAEAFKRFQF